MNKTTPTIKRLLKLFKNSDKDDWIASEFYRIIDGKEFRYSELSKTAQLVACRSYWNGLEAEQQQEIKWRYCHEFCMDTDNDEQTFNRNGTDYE